MLRRLPVDPRNPTMQENSLPCRRTGVSRYMMGRHSLVGPGIEQVQAGIHQLQISLQESSVCPEGLTGNQENSIGTSCHSNSKGRRVSLSSALSTLARGCHYEDSPLSSNFPVHVPETQDAVTLDLHLPVTSRMRKKSEADLKHSCPKCPKKFAFLSKLRDHNLCHSRQRKFECQVCPKKYVRKRELVRHYRRTHPEHPEPESHSPQPDPHSPDPSDTGEPHMIGEISGNKSGSGYNYPPYYEANTPHKDGAAESQYFPSIPEGDKPPFVATVGRINFQETEFPTGGDINADFYRAFFGRPPTFGYSDALMGAFGEHAGNAQVEYEYASENIY